MELPAVANALRSPGRLKLLRIIRAERLSAAEVHRRLVIAEQSPRHRESVYRDLEILVHCGVLSKQYDHQTKAIVYGLVGRQIVIDLLETRATVR